MYLYVLFAFALLMGLREPPFEPWLRDPLGSLMANVALIALPALLAAWGTVTALRRLRCEPARPYLAQLLHHRVTLGLRILLLGGFAATLYLTEWGEWSTSRTADRVPALGEMLAALPFVLGLLAIWLAQYPIDRALRAIAIGSRAWEARGPARVWTLGEYLLFNVRHQLLVIAVPMLLIMAAYDLVHQYERALQRASGVIWAADALLALWSGTVFMLAPVLLRYIWPTSRLPDGPLRARLEGMCARLGLRCRDILVWHSGGMMVNAAVMGLFAPVRYVLLSDGLLDAMDERRIEAVFGHEAGHVRHRHILYFVIFALASMFVVTGVMEGLAHLTRGTASRAWLGERTIELVGAASAALVWGLGFGWISRRFERQADVFGARCVTPSSPDECRLPCSLHADAARAAPPGALCATAASVFTGALERVARLNGIPINERSWRHSSIGNRMRFLTRLASDPRAGRRFERLINRIKLTLAATAAIGALASAYYYSRPAFPPQRPDPAARHVQRTR